MSNKKEHTFHSFAALGEAKAHTKEARHGKQPGPASPANLGSPVISGTMGTPMRPIPGSRGMKSRGTGSGKSTTPAQGIDPAEASLFLAAMAAVTPAGHKHAKSHHSQRPYGGKKTTAGMAAPAEAGMGDEERLFLAATTRFGQPLSPFVSAAPGQEANDLPKSDQQKAPSGPQPSIHGAGSPLVQAERALWAREAGGEERMSTEEDSLFSKAMQGVAPVTTRGRQVHAVVGKKGGVAADKAAAFALADFWAAKLEFTLANTGEYLEGFVKGTDPIVVEKLRAGAFSPEAHVDLHGQNAQQAYDSLLFFMKNAYQRNLRCVLVITGRGKNSPDGVGVLRPQLQCWLTREPFKRVVLAFCTAKPGDGGPGAVYVLLRKFKKSRGKIMWERLPAHDDFIDC